MSELFISCLPEFFWVTEFIMFRVGLKRYGGERKTYYGKSEFKK